jgi:hypothetical protein
MPHILIDELHLTVSAPGNLRAAAYRAIRRTLNDGRFHTTLRRAIRTVLGRYPSLNKVRISLTR